MTHDVSAVRDVARRFEITRLSRSAVLHVAPLVFALVAALAVYWPSLNSAFYSDDYVYLYAVKDLSFAHYLHVSLVPGSNDSVLTFTADFWRPLYFLSFEPMGRLFGGHLVLYHLVNLAIHFAGIILLWVLARRLTGRWEAAGVAAAIFAVHPAAIDAISWISSVNSVAVPLSLGAWLCFMSSLDEHESASRRRTLIGVSMLLFAIALGFRETAVVFMAGMALWYVLVPARGHWFEWQRYLPLVPFVVLGLLYLLLRTKFLTASATNPALFQIDAQVPHHVVYYLKIAFFPFGQMTTTGWHLALQRIGAGVILVAIPVALVTRRWLLLGLLLGLIVAALPYSTLTLGVSPRYFYFPSTFFALAVGVVAVEALDVARKLVPRSRPIAVGAAVLVAGLIMVGYLANSRVESWVTQNPDVHQSFVDQLRTEYPTLPSGGTLYVANAPLIIALFGYYSLMPTAGYYYPQVAHAVPFDLPKQSQLHLGPDDRVFVYHPGG